MSYRNSPPLVVIVCMLTVSLFICLSIFQHAASSGSDTKKQDEQRIQEKQVAGTNDFQGEIQSREDSPDGERAVLLYQLPSHLWPADRYDNYLANQNIVAVKEYASDREQFVSIADYRSGYPHWLGNDHIFFTVGCGTDCEGISLVSEDGKESRFAIMSWDVSSQDIWGTTFQDWFGTTFTFAGMVSGVRSSTLDGKNYLIFTRDSGDSRPLPEKRFLFTDTALKEL